MTQTETTASIVKTNFKYPYYFNSFVSSSFIEHFNFIRLKSVTSCQEWLGEGTAISVARWWTVGESKVRVRTWAVNVNILSSAKSGSMARTTVYGVTTKTILSCLWEFHWSPAWLPSQWEQKGARTVMVCTIGGPWSAGVSIKDVFSHADDDHCRPFVVTMSGR